MPTPLDILQQYWSYDQFRPAQEEIVQSVLDGKDTLALLPTGGGKSICFQVPTLARDGLCIVVSPLIALMKDQVANLRKRNIGAQAIVSGMHRREIDIALDNCAYGNIKFLYVSPERLTTDLFRERLNKMNVNLLAVDEAHCISQWGYDFRPPYLRIAEIREQIPEVPVLALTATATPEVVEDIQDKLDFGKANVISRSFERSNLAYVVQREEDKLHRLKRIFQRLPGSGIVYVRSRRRTEEIAKWINQQGIKADYYHAGLDSRVRDQKQKNWVDNRCRIIVATNAFGMGIDKPDVRFVVHIDLPDSLEAYFQEAGRAGRDGESAYAILLAENPDILDLRSRTEMGFPEIEQIKRVYQAIANFYQLAAGGGEGSTYPFDLNAFANQYRMKYNLVFHSLKFMEKEGYLSLSEAVHQPSRIHMPIDKNDLYRFQVANKKHDAFIKLLLRSYSGLFDDYVKINESEIARRFDSTRSAVIAELKRLETHGILSYLPQNHLPHLTFTRDRVHAEKLVISNAHYLDRKRTAFERMESVIKYVETGSTCRSRQLLAWFGQKKSRRCGRCDVCLDQNKQGVSDEDYAEIRERVREVLDGGSQPMEKILAGIPEYPEKKLLEVIRRLQDNGVLAPQDGGLIWR